jgi:hypothetical protein
MVARPYPGSLSTVRATWEPRESEKRFADEANRVAREGGSNMEIRQGPGGAIYEKIGGLVCGKLLVMLAQARGFLALLTPWGFNSRGLRTGLWGFDFRQRGLKLLVLWPRARQQDFPLYLDL